MQKIIGKRNEQADAKQHLNTAVRSLTSHQKTEQKTCKQKNND